jgi:hypothetical protein
MFDIDVVGSSERQTEQYGDVIERSAVRNVPVGRPNAFSQPTGTGCG